MKERIIEALKDAGVKEVILEEEPNNSILFAGDDERVVMTNKDWADAGL